MSLGIPQVKAFVARRLQEMSVDHACDSREEFVARLILLVETSWIGTPESFAERRQALVDALWTFSDRAGELFPWWTRKRVDIARRFACP